MKLIHVVLSVLLVARLDCLNLDKISIKGKWFVDEDGRITLFRGINAVNKAFPWVPNNKYVDMTNSTQLRYLSKEWGFNAVRLGFMWSGLIPEKGYVNKTYLDTMLKIIDNLANYGIYVLIDLHQDMMSSEFNAYDGVPLWVMKELPAPRRPFPWPFQDGSKLVFEAYVTDACGFAFECLYRNVSNFQDYFLQYWSVVAMNLANKTSVLGYEIINEPWAGDIYSNPLILLPGITGKKNLMPLYDKTYDAIRQYDSKTIIFYEPVTWSVMSSEAYIGTGFDRPPRNDPNTTALAWHYYCWLLQTNPQPLKNGTFPHFEKVFCDGWQAVVSFRTVEKDSLKLGNSANFLTEFGVCSFNAEDKQNSKRLNTEECELILDYCDNYFTSWSYWDSNFYYYDNFQINHQLVNVFSRVYPRKINGVPLSMSYNFTTGKFSFTFEMNLARTDLSTEIFIPNHVYPNGFQVVANPELLWKFDSYSNVLYLNLRNNISKIVVNYFFVLIFKN